MKLLLSLFISITLVGCSVVGQDNVESAPYTLIKSDKAKKIEIRNYDSMVLVSTSMSGDSGYSAFRTLFNYITGDNEGAIEISMTAPVFLGDKSVKNKGTQISMTAPVFINKSANTSLMSFVMPKDFTLETTPKPTNPDVKVSEVKDYKVAAIQFNGTLSDSNVEKYTEILNTWIVENGFTSTSQAITAGYNGPLTIPFWRRNEVLIEIK
ncbi:MAG: hypothetical protein ACI93V_000411 [Alteromonadaceae bacterium]|jgi:hypothetical protein|tara:strand:- start:442 stop:1071 length:630 start_codon:yes stop_codon:yes gene_type:complete